MVENGEENPNRAEFSFQDDIDALKIFGPIALKKTIEAQNGPRNNQPNNKKASNNGQRYNYVTYNNNRQKNQVQVKLPNHVATKPSTASLDLGSVSSSFREVTQGEHPKKRRYNQLVLSPWDDSAAKKAIN